MTVSESLGAALTARQAVAPGEPILWASWQRRLTFHIEGHDENGRPLPKKKRGSIGRAVAEFAMDGALTALFGDGDDHSGAGGSVSPPTDLFIVGPQEDCTAVHLIRRAFPPDHDVLRMLWVLTPERLAVLLPLKEDSDAKPSSQGSPGGLRGFLSGPEKFGDNEPGKPLPNRRVSTWWQIAVTDIVDCRPVGSRRRPHSHCKLQLADGSGFVLNAKTPSDAQLMADIVNRQRGTRG